MSDGSLTLRYAVHISVVGKYLGQLSFMLALLTLVPFSFSLYFAEYGITLRYGLVITLLFIVAAVTGRLPIPSQLQQNEALAIVCLTFLLSPLLMSFPMMGAGLSWNDALFEAISAITTTGLSTLPEIETMPQSFLFARAWMQWYGGLGIVVLSIALLQGHYAASRRLAEPPTAEGLASTTRTYARHILIVYLLLTTLAVTILLLMGLSPFAALTHALTAISTGGFSTYDNSLGSFHKGQSLAVILIGLCGAVPLHLYYRIRRCGISPPLKDVELHTLLLFTAISSAAITLFLLRNGQPWSEALFHGVIQGISAQTTSGFSSLTVENLDNASKLSLIISMFLGGGIGSTAGGIKLLRVLIVLRLVQLLLQRSALPEHALSPAKLAGRPLDENDIQGALLLILLFTLIILLSWLVFVAHGYPPLDALFEVVSATGTVGLTSGITGPALEPLLRTILMIDMYAGRLEIVALLVVLYPPTWFNKRTES